MPKTKDELGANAVEIKNSTSKQKSLNEPLVKEYYEAVERGDIAQVKKVLEKKSVDVDVHVDTWDNTALSIACSKCHTPIVDLLLKQGANPDHINKKGGTPLYIACIHDNFGEIVDLLLDHKANPNLLTLKGNSPLAHAAVSPHALNIVAKLLKHKANPDTTWNGRPLLALFPEKKALVKMLLKYGAKPVASNTTSPSSEKLPKSDFDKEALELQEDKKIYLLINAVEAGNYHEVYRLVEEGADPNGACFSSRGLTAMHVAAIGGQIQIMKYLHQHGGDINKKNGAGQTPLNLAALYNQRESVEFLLAEKGDPNIPDDEGRTPLHNAFAMR
jgi:ankyrin repeat protein